MSAKVFEIACVGAVSDSGLTHETALLTFPLTDRGYSKFPGQLQRALDVLFENLNLINYDATCTLGVVAGVMWTHDGLVTNMVVQVTSTSLSRLRQDASYKGIGLPRYYTSLVIYALGEDPTARMLYPWFWTDNWD